MLTDQKLHSSRSVSISSDENIFWEFYNAYLDQFCFSKVNSKTRISKLSNSTIIQFKDSGDPFVTRDVLSAYFRFPYIFIPLISLLLLIKTPNYLSTQWKQLEWNWSPHLQPLWGLKYLEENPFLRHIKFYYHKMFLPNQM